MVRSSPIAPVLAAVLVASLAVDARAQDPNSGREFGAEVSVTLVQIPVEVLRQGEPVEGLTAADFEVTEAGKALPIVGVEAIHLMTARDQPGALPPRAVPAAARRYLVLYFDFAFTHPHRLLDGIAAARSFVATGLTPTDLVAVVASLPSGRVPFLVQFTPDRGAADRALAALADSIAGKAKGGAVAKQTGEAPLLLQNERTKEENLPAETLKIIPPSSSTELEETLLAIAEMEQPNMNFREAGHIRAFSRALSLLGEVLRPVEGRKYMTVFSEGFPFDQTADLATTERLQGLLKDLNATVASLRRTGWVVNAVDVGGLEAGFRSGSLFYFTDQTGGELIEATNLIAPALTRVLERSARSYLLSVQVDVAADGSYHPIEVKLRKPLRRGVQLRHREGYFAPRPDRPAAADLRPTGLEDRDELGMEFLAVPLRVDGDVVPVAVLIEVSGPALSVGDEQTTVLEVFAEADRTSDRFAQRLELDRAKLGAQLAAGGVRILGQLELGRGQRRVRVVVRDLGSGRISQRSVTLDLTAPVAGSAPRFDAVFLATPGDSWIEASPGRTSFLLHGRDVVPAARVTLEPKGETSLLVLGTGFGRPDQTIGWKIVDERDRPVSGGEVEFLAFAAGTAQGEPDLLVGRLRAGTLPPGTYRLVVTAGATEASVSSSRTFAVKP